MRVLLIKVRKLGAGNITVQIPNTTYKIWLSGELDSTVIDFDACGVFVFGWHLLG